MRFGSVDMFMEFGEWGFRMGRPIANEGFLRALLTYGAYDIYQFFCPDVYHIEKFQGRMDELIPEPSLRSRVKTSLQIALVETIREEDFQVFHLGDFTYFMPSLAGIRNRQARRPFPITGVTHSLDGVFMNLRYLELLLAGLAPFDRIICTSHCAQKTVGKGLAWVREQIRRQWGVTFQSKSAPRLAQIPLGIEETFFDDFDKNAAKEFFNIPRDKIVCLSVGRLSPRLKMDWSPVLELLARMATESRLENLLLIIAGGGNESDVPLLKSLVAQSGLEEKVVIFANFLPEVKTRLYHAADFYLSLVDNFQETFGLNIVEAMASGLPVVASDFNGYRELVTHGESGFLIKTVWSGKVPDFLLDNLGILSESLARFYFSQTVAVDVNELEQAIMALCTDVSLRTRMGLAARQSARAYRWQKIIHLYEALWSDLAKEAGKADFSTGYKGPGVLWGDPVSTFLHYPSKIMNDNDVVALTSVGRDILDGGRGLVRYEDVAVSLFFELETLILQMLSEGSQSVRAIKEQAEIALKATGAQTEFHVLWLLKHGALALDIPGKLWLQRGTYETCASGLCLRQKPFSNR